MATARAGGPVGALVATEAGALVDGLVEGPAEGADVQAASATHSPAPAAAARALTTFPLARWRIETFDHTEAGHRPPVSSSHSMRFPSSSQWAATFLLGCTLGGSPGILG